MKRNKIGTTILLALAPACALGVTVGVLATSKQGETEPKFDVDTDGNVKADITALEKEGTLTIPAKIGDKDVKGIAENGFKGAKATNIVLESPTIADHIGIGAFDDCPNLEGINFGRRMMFWKIINDSGVTIILQNKSDKENVETLEKYSKYAWERYYPDKLYTTGDFNEWAIGTEMTKVQDGVFKYDFIPTDNSEVQFQIRLNEEGWDSLTEHIYFYPNDFKSDEKFITREHDEPDKNLIFTNIKPFVKYSFIIDLNNQKVWGEESTYKNITYIEPAGTSYFNWNIDAGKTNPTVINDGETSITVNYHHIGGWAVFTGRIQVKNENGTVIGESNIYGAPDPADYSVTIQLNAAPTTNITMEFISD